MTLVKNSLVQFSLDAQASLFTVQAFAAGIVAVVAHSPKFAVRNFYGTVSFDPDSLEESAVDMTIKVSSLDLLDEVRSNERREIERVMFDEVLESGRYPVVEFKSSRAAGIKTGENMYRINLQGDLQLHGNSQPMRLETQVMVGEETLKAQGSFSIRQSDYGLRIAAVAGGSLTLKDELKCTYFITARRQRTAAKGR
jgi:polyisoprenoid-binding protein YceI